MGWMPGGGESVDSQVMSHRSAGPVDWGHGVRALEEDWTPQRMGSRSGQREARASPRAPSGPGGKVGDAPGTGLGVELQFRLGQAGWPEASVFPSVKWLAGCFSRAC